MVVCKNNKTEQLLEIINIISIHLSQTEATEICQTRFSYNPKTPMEAPK